MSDKPTPGPWFTSDRAERPSESGVSIMAKVSGEEVAVAECWVRGGISLEAAQANARQLAAAPGMLAVLESVWANVDARTHLGDDLLGRVRAAIREAQGLPPVVFGKWVFSRDEEAFSSDEFDTQDEALEEALASLDLRDGEGFYLGRTADPLELGGDADPSWDSHIVDTVDVEAFEVECGFKGCGAKTLLARVKNGPSPGIWTPKGWDLIADEACCSKPEHWAAVTEPAKEVKP